MQVETVNIPINWLKYHVQSHRINKNYKQITTTTKAQLIIHLKYVDGISHGLIFVYENEEKTNGGGLVLCALCIPWASWFWCVRCHQTKNSEAESLIFGKKMTESSFSQLFDHIRNGFDFTNPRFVMHNVEASKKSYFFLQMSLSASFFSFFHRDSEWETTQTQTPTNTSLYHNYHSFTLQIVVARYVEQEYGKSFSNGEWATVNSCKNSSVWKHGLVFEKQFIILHNKLPIRSNIQRLFYEFTTLSWSNECEMNNVFSSMIFLNKFMKKKCIERTELWTRQSVFGIIFILD